MKTALILAAGRGERLKPLTKFHPKAMCLVKDKPLIEHHVLHLAQAGFERIVINHAYLGGQIRHYLGDGSRWGVPIVYSPEPPGGLETGGGIVQALPLFNNKPFITVNADIYTNFDFKQLQIETEENLHLILVPKNPSLGHHGDFSLVNQDQLSITAPDYTFSGIACYHPQIFNNSRLGRYSVTPLIQQYIRANKAKGSLHEGYWYDIGSLERLHAANHHQ